jgi:AraC-like DNA-binding protein
LSLSYWNKIFNFYSTIGRFLIMNDIMKFTFNYNLGRSAVISFCKDDSCHNINTENVYNIILIGKGSLTLCINGKQSKGNAPCVFALKENLTVEFVSSQKLSAQVISFDVAFLYRSVTFETINSNQYESLTDKLNLVPLTVFYKCPDTFSYVLPLSDAEYIRANSFFINFHEALLNQHYERWSCQARQYLNVILELIHQAHIDLSNSVTQRKNPQEWVQILLNKIHTNYPNGTQISLVPLANEIGINKDTVSKKFREIVGCSVGDYIVNYRIKCACYSLGNTECSVKEIAYRCGFGSETYFIRQFKKRKGITPKQFREHELKLRQQEFSLGKVHSTLVQERGFSS